MGTKPSLSSRTTAISKRLMPLIDQNDTSQAELLKRLAHQLAIAETAQQQLEADGLTIDGKYGTKPHPAINIGYNANALALRFFNALQLDKNEEQFADLGI